MTAAVDPFVLARQQMQANCPHTIVVEFQPQCGPDFIEEFPTYQCQACGKLRNWWNDLDRDGNVKIVQAHADARPR